MHTHVSDGPSRKADIVASRKIGSHKPTRRVAQRATEVTSPRITDVQAAAYTIPTESPIIQSWLSRF